MTENGMSHDDIDDILNSISAEETGITAEEESSSASLSQDGIDDLLGAIAAGEDEEWDCRENSSPDRESMMVKIYDFLRPDIFTMSDLRMINEKTDRLLLFFTSRLEAFTGEKINCSVASMDQLTLDELMRSQPNPSAILPVDFHQPEKGGIFFTLQAADIMTKLFLGLPAELFEYKKDDVLNPVMLNIFKKLIDLSLVPCISEIFTECSVNGIHTTPEPGIMADPLEMMLTVTMDLSIPGCGLSSMAAMALPGNRLKGILSGLKAEASDDAESDYLVDTGIQFTTLMNENEIINCMQKGTVNPADRRSMGRMIYEKRKES